MAISTFDFERMQARCSAGRAAAVTPAGVDNEGALHDEILAECRRRLWPVVHSRMDMATTTARGCPDFVIFGSAGRVFAVECKTAKGKLTPEQIGWQMLLERNGHACHVVRSMADFLDLIKSE